ncbi:MAG: CPXCG motif-containing cysteine-rich protein [Deltaproteobacteria bacterium HGW-Deltaproteobacteria-14]|jgi:hypothetical protein|nr:MAG: CPXCG motif-containing cysteine-rich protein [Deltaproteobacteria bacterium HGW-Deltaproteobacteria-14]
MEVETYCPYCGERISVWVDAGGGGTQRYIEDCAVCCRPIEITAHADGDGEFSVDAQRGDA